MKLSKAVFCALITAALFSGNTTFATECDAAKSVQPSSAIENSDGRVAPQGTVIPVRPTRLRESVTDMLQLLS